MQLGGFLCCGFTSAALRGSGGGQGVVEFGGELVLGFLAVVDLREISFDGGDAFLELRGRYGGGAVAFQKVQFRVIGLAQFLNARGVGGDLAVELADDAPAVGGAG